MKDPFKVPKLHIPRANL